MKNLRDNLPLFLILLLGAVLRFYHFDSWSLSNDELSAIYRAQLATPHEWIGVGDALDGHPLGVQVFLHFWILLFGNSAFAVRLPFVVMGIASIYLAFQIAKHWFGKTTALFSALLISVSGFFILYSQLARPYSPGLFFALLMVLFWTKIIFQNKDEIVLNKKQYWGFALATAACMYTHYFSFLFATIVGITGIFFVKRNKIIPYILSGFSAAILFLPHLSFTLEQLGVGGLTWLAKPGNDALLLYINKGLNDSDFLLIPVALVFVGSFVFNYKNWRFTKFHFLTLLWFLLPFGIAFFYSIYKLPVLQYSVLIFSFPFFVFYIFSYLPNTNSDSRSKSNIGLVLLGCFGAFSLTADNKFYSTQHFGKFRELAETTIEWNKKFGEKNITRTSNLNHPFYIDYYFEKLGEKNKFTLYSINSGEELGELNRIIDTCSTNYFLYAWSTADNLPEVNQIIENKFPYIAGKKSYFNSGITLFSKTSNETEPKTKPFWILNHDFEKAGVIGNDSAFRTTGISRSAKHSVLMNNEREYSSTFEKRLSEIRPPNDSALLLASVWVYLPELNSDAEFVVSFESLNSTYDWHSQKLNNFVTKPKEWTQVFVGRRIPKLPSKEDVIKIYIWNPQKKTFYIDDLKIETVLEN